MVGRGRSTTARRRSQRLGRWAEWLAAALLLAKGYRVIARRHKTPVGEIDLIARCGRTIAFVEVKARSSPEDAAIAVTERQQKRIARAASHWLSQNEDLASMDLRFDVITVATGFRVHHLKDAFRT